MAGDWIKMRMDLPEDPAVIGIAQKTGLDEDTVVGKLFRVWCWANRQTIDGNAPTVTTAFLDRYVSVTGFAQAMVDMGWLDTTHGGISLPDFEKHNSETAKQRALTAIRVRKHRNAESVNTSVTEALPEKRREEKRRREEKSPLNPPKGKSVFEPLKVELPKELDTPTFRAAWADWAQHRKEKNQKLTPTSVGRQLKKLAAMGADQAIEMIEYTIEKSWIGLRPPEQKDAPRKGEIGYEPNGPYTPI